MKNTDLRTEFTAETQKRFNVEWVAYNDYAEWLEQKLVKLLTIAPVIKSVCDQTCPYWGYQCNINRMFEDCKKQK
jgi:hypothetical protein